MTNKIQNKHLIQHETKRSVLLRFLFVLLVFVTYFIFIAWKYGIEQGFFVSVLTWSFFVLCTPVADAGFLLAFPLRLITHIKMLYSQIVIFIIAILLNLYAYFITPQIYSKTILLDLFKHILSQPFPFWSIIFISLIGTFISISFGDELVDKASHHERTQFHKHRNKHRIILMIFLFAISFVIYDFLLKALGIDMPL